MQPSQESTSRTLVLEHGNVHFHELGEGPNLLMIHGSGPGVSGWANFQGNLAFFAKRFRCIVIDLPGYGRSDPIAGDPVGGCVTVTLGLLDKLGIAKTHIIGNSLGGAVGSHIAAQHPQRVSSFVSIGGVGLNLFSAFPAEGLNLLTAFAEDPTREKIELWLRSMVFDQSIVTDALIDMRFAQATQPESLATTRAIYARESIQAIAAFRSGKLATRTIEHLSSIVAPTLLTWGRDDRVTPLDICLIPMRLIPDCELHVFPNCGHWAMIECKARFESLVDAFLVRNEPLLQR